MVNLGLLRYVTPAEVRQSKALLLPQELLYDLFHSQQMSGLGEMPKVSVVTVAALKCRPSLAFPCIHLRQSHWTATDLYQFRTCTGGISLRCFPEKVHAVATSEGTNLDLRSRLRI